MTDAPPQNPPGADPTRDVRLVALPRPGPPAVVPTAVDQETDQLGPPVVRERTIAFSSPEMAHGRRMPTISRTPRRPRRWPWIVLSLLPVVVIVVTGIWWLLLLRAA